MALLRYEVIMPGVGKTLRQFPPTFYVANGMEIFERMAWYGFYALVGLYLTASVEKGGLGLSDTDRGVITGVVPFLLYLFPVFTGALADKFGYKRTFLVAFALMTPGYYLLGLATGFWSFFLIFLVVALGAALFKPVVTGTVARVTTSDTKALGFGIFYMIVNVGGFLGPLVATIVRGDEPGGWKWIFVLSTGWIAVNFLFLFFYREPSTAGAAAGGESFARRMRRVWDDMTHVLGNSQLFVFVAALLILLMLAGGAWISWTEFLVGAGLLWAVQIVLELIFRALERRPSREQAVRFRHWGRVRLGDWRFALYLLILAGFWTGFNQIFLTMPLFVRDYTDTTAIQQGVSSLLEAVPAAGSWLDEQWQRLLSMITTTSEVTGRREIKPENLINLDALAIVFGQIAITALIARWKPFTAMITGTLVTGASMLLGIWSGIGWVCVTSILIFAVGEMMASPKSQEYVARIAPPDKEAMYMGYYFVTIALGNLFGGLLSGQAYKYFANLETGIGRPDLMWMLFAGIALVTAVLLAGYDRLILGRALPDAADASTRES